MFEGLFVLTTIFVAYVIYQVVNDKKISAKTVVPKAEPAKKPESAKKAEPAKPKEEAKKEEPKAPEPVVNQTPPIAASTEVASKTGLRNPKTGEVATAYTNYRFTKRWIKDALVSEGLLDKIYKNNELDAPAEAKIKAALSKLEAMDKYKA